MVKTLTGYFSPFVVKVGVENRPVARGSAKKVLFWLQNGPKNGVILLGLGLGP